MQCNIYRTTPWFVLICLMLGSCQTIYYNFWETLGQEKRDLLQSNVAKVQNDQREVQEAFKDTLERVRAEYKLEASDLEDFYDDLSANYEQARARAEALSERTEKVRDIASDLFSEWEAEAKTITNATYRSDSLAKLRVAKTEFGEMDRHMTTVLKKIDPVLVKLNDRVLYLKHNLNARAVQVFQKEFQSVEGDIQSLIKDIEASIEASQSFMAELS